MNQPCPSMEILTPVVAAYWRKVGPMLSLTVLLKLALKKVANSGKPLYASLDDQQKCVFGFLAREMM